MAIVKEEFARRKHKYDYFYSDEGLKIIRDQTEILYDSAVDLHPSPYTYTESDIPIETESEPE